MSKKLTLDLESLSVQSFETGAAGAARGTVRGNAKECTVWASCDCASGYWACTTSNQTKQSCEYTQYGNTCESFPTERDPSCMC